jgi:phosphoribosylformimino-5-aminoimidazole carboxamide ribotide isomerase
LSDLLSAETIHRLIGVIDLLQGRAVHAVAGDRDHYRPVEFCDGDPRTLGDHYARLGVSRLYIADLDAITGGPIQVESIDRICRTAVAGETLVDIGWTGDEDDGKDREVAKLSAKYPHMLWIAATESARWVAALEKLAGSVGPARALIGLDYRGGELIAEDGDERSWIEHAVQLQCGGAVILDLASVGTSRGPSTLEICRRVRRLGPTLPLYSGGGIRSADDVRLLTEAGCDRCLVATALHQFPND